MGGSEYSWHRFQIFRSLTLTLETCIYSIRCHGCRQYWPIWTLGMPGICFFENQYCDWRIEAHSQLTPRSNSYDSVTHVFVWLTANSHMIESKEGNMLYIWRASLYIMVSGLTPGPPPERVRMKLNIHSRRGSHYRHEDIRSEWRGHHILRAKQWSAGMQQRWLTIDIHISAPL